MISVSAFLSAIHYLINVKDEISLTQLQQGLKMPMVEVWLGLLLGGFTLLLLGGFTLEQRGDFYNSRNIWVKSSPNTNTNPI